jgi:hypothetical protein
VTGGVGVVRLECGRFPQSISQNCMDPKVSLPFSHKPATSACPEPDEYSPYHASNNIFRDSSTSQHIHIKLVIHDHDAEL